MTTTLAPAPFDQAYYPRGPLTIAFESAQVTYSDLSVDLYNSGVNQILSVAAVRGHRLLHFSMADLHQRSGQPAADVSVLELDPGWGGSPCVPTMSAPSRPPTSRSCVGRPPLLGARAAELDAAPARVASEDPAPLAARRG